MLVSYDENFGRKVEAMAEAMWKEDAVMGAGKRPSGRWSEVPVGERDRWTRLAQVALLTEKAVDAYDRPAA